MKLRPYQTKIIDDVKLAMREGHKSVLVCSPVASGKTTIFSAFTHAAAAKGNRVLLLAHRQELLEQMSETLSRFDVEHTVLSGGGQINGKPKVLVASVQTAHRRDIGSFDLAISDECHHLCAGNTWHRTLEHANVRYHIGFSASPARLDGKPLGDVFSKIILGPSVRWLIDNGFLAQYKMFSPAGPELGGVKSRMGDFVKSELAAAVNKPSITGSAIAHYMKLAHGKQAIVFCASIEHSKSVAAQFKAAGVNATHLDGETDRLSRKQAMADFASGKINVLCNVDLFGEGLSIDGIQVCVLLRPTQSLVLHTQQVGRALRTHPGKPHAIILDHAGNTLRHGLPCDERQWSLTSRIEPKTNKSKPTLSVKVCPQCFFAMKSGPTSCPNCNFVFPIESRIPEHVDGELKEIDLTERRQRRQQQGMAQTKEQLVAIAKARGFKRPHAWAHFVWQSRLRKQRGIK